MCNNVLGMFFVIMVIVVVEMMVVMVGKGFMKKVIGISSVVVMVVVRSGIVFMKSLNSDVVMMMRIMFQLEISDIVFRMLVMDRVFI